ncbi:MAG: AAA family ATPase, partial [Lachnospiraceae bacterium]|nr:AAA family ATPase [Lachnospiraceae bacterium]
MEAHLKEWEDIYGNEQADCALSIRFQYLIKKAAETTGKNVVVLVDEYDKP